MKPLVALLFAGLIALPTVSFAQKKPAPQDPFQQPFEDELVARRAPL